MNDVQERQVESIERGHNALADVPTLATTRALRRIRDRLAQIIAAVRRVALKQYSAEHGRTGTKVDIAVEKRFLRNQYLIRLSRRVTPLFKQEPKIRAALRVPKARATARQHAEAALAMVEALRPYEAFCVEEGLPRGFLNKVETAGKKMRRTALRSDNARKAYSDSTHELKVTILEGRRQLGLADAELRALVDSTRYGDPGPTRPEYMRMHEHFLQQVKLWKKIGRPRVRRSKPEPPPPDTA